MAEVLKVTEDQSEDRDAGVQPAYNVSVHPRAELGHLMRITEALLFAASEPLSADDLESCLPDGSDVTAVLAAL